MMATFRSELNLCFEGSKPMHDLLTVWRERYGNNEMTASELHEDVKAILVPRAKDRSRQRIAAQLARLARKGVLVRIPGRQRFYSNGAAAKSWEPEKYRLDS
jgi:hypothetical protein